MCDPGFSSAVRKVAVLHETLLELRYLKTTAGGLAHTWSIALVTALSFLQSLPYINLDNIVYLNLYYNVPQ